MPRTEEQYEEIREHKRNLIMDAALDLFANAGYHNTTISKIAGKAGISKGLIYNYFESKEALVNAILDKGISSLIKGFDPNKDGYLTEEEFEFFIRETFSTIRSNAGYWKLYYAVSMQPAVFRMISERYKEMIPRLLNIIRQYFERKGIPDPELEALYFGALLDGISFNFIISPENYPLDKMTELIIKKYK